MDKVETYLPKFIFSHGQLCMALLRVRQFPDINTIWFQTRSSKLFPILKYLQKNFEKKFRFSKPVLYSMG